MGLGSVIRVSLAQARAKAAKLRGLLDQGLDPLDQKVIANIAPVTFLDRANAFLKARGAGWNKTHQHQWRKAIDDYLAPIAGMPVAAVDTAAVLRCLTPVWHRESQIPGGNFAARSRWFSIAPPPSDCGQAQTQPHGAAIWL
jgi:hypothetical protein